MSTSPERTSIAPPLVDQPCHPPGGTGAQPRRRPARQTSDHGNPFSDLLAPLRDGATAGVTNAILADFLGHLQAIEDAVQSHHSRPLASWKGSDAAWKGFYLALQQELGEGGWHYVANPSGGFMSFYGSWHSVPDCMLYLQLEEELLCVKISVGDKAKRSRLRNTWSHRVTEAAKARGLPLGRRFGHGEWMTVAVWSGEYRQVGDDCLLDLEGTVARLREVMALVDEVAAAERPLG